VKLLFCKSLQVNPEVLITASLAVVQQMLYIKKAKGMSGKLGKWAEYGV
jgi:hypothetical protein